MSARLDIIITGTGGPSEWGDQDTVGYLVDKATETSLHGHFSSSVAFLVHDLCSNFGRADLLAEKYPDGWDAYLNDERVASWAPPVASTDLTTPECIAAGRHIGSCPCVRPMTRRFIFTFPVEDALRRDSYLVVDATDEVSARMRVIDHYGRKFGSCYPESDPRTAEMIEKYGLTEIEFGK